MKRLIWVFLLALLSGLRGEARAYRVELVLNSLNFPVAMVFLPDGRLLFTEKNTGQIRVVQGGVLRPQPYLTVPVNSSGERGLLGITMDPDFATNSYVYIYHTNPSPLENRVVRFRDSTGYGVNPTVILTAPVVNNSFWHHGGNLHFGPDRKLYVSLGENAQPAYSQDSTVIYGKVVRINSDGTSPPDNPYFNVPGADQRIWALGLRNSFDFDFDPLTGNLIATENGPSCDDELNRIVRKGNYGWRPSQPCGDTSSRYLTPILRINPVVAPVGGHYYRGSQVPGWRNDYFFSEINTGRLKRVVLGGANRDSVVSVDTVGLGGVPCNLDIETGPDGALYFTNTSALYRIVSGTSVTRKAEGERSGPSAPWQAVPTPFRSFALIPGHEDEEFPLFNVSGRLVGTYRGDRIGEGLPAGVYFLRPSAVNAKPIRIVKLR